MGAMMYMYDFDDPYRILAHNIVGFYRPSDVLRVMTDNTYLATLVQKEVRSLDIGGSFLDCIVEDILVNKKRMEMMGALDTLAMYFYSKLDKERLRREIHVALDDLGITLRPEDYGLQAQR